jgi:tryptophan-rich sensory protein
MIWPALLKTVIVCGISIIIEAISATKEGKTWFGNLRRPKYSFSFRVWYMVGAFYYIIFGIVAYRQFSIGKSFSSLSIILLIAVMLLNGLSNFIIFKYRSIKWFYLVIYPFALILLALIIILSKDDMISASLASLYFLWLFYDLYYGYNMWKLNKP